MFNWFKKDKAIKQTIKGQSASGGKAKGQVKIVTGDDDLDKIEKGDILVVNEMTPSLKNKLKEAGAILTIQGGMTAHPAKLARELGIPCIVGIQNADRLKDEDRVEVDAGKGEVVVL